MYNKLVIFYKNHRDFINAIIVFSTIGSLFFNIIKFFSPQKSNASNKKIGINTPSFIKYKDNVEMKNGTDSSSLKTSIKTGLGGSIKILKNGSITQQD